jgi:hypothetical protein
MKLKLTLKPPFILYNDNDTLCECGEHKKCVRKINASDNGRLWVENKDHFRCGKVRNQIEKLKEMLPSLFSKQDKIMERFIANAKQETLEDAAEKHVEINVAKNAAKLMYKEHFIAGAKWQQEQFKNESTAHYIDRHIVEAMVEVAKQKMYSEEDMIEGAKYGYNFHKTTSFPNQEFKDSCVRNTQQWLTTYKKK